MDAIRNLIGPDNGDASALQLSARAVILFIAGIALIRVAGRKTFSQASPLDIIVALIIGSNLSRAMTGKAPFWPALAATLVLVLLHRIVAMATLHWGPLARLVKGRPVILVQDGVVVDGALMRHAVSRDDLLAGLRSEQVDDVSSVKVASLEGGGKISVVLKSGPKSL